MPTPPEWPALGKRLRDMLNVIEGRRATTERSEEAEAAPSAGPPAEALRILELVREVYSDPPEGDFGLWLTRQIEKHHALASDTKTWSERSQEIWRTQESGATEASDRA